MIRNSLDHFIRNLIMKLRYRVRKSFLLIKCLIFIERFFEFIYLIGPRG